MSMFVKASVSIVSAGLMALAGYLVKAGIWSPDDAASYVAGASLLLVTLGIEWYKNRKSEDEVEQALAAPANTSRALLAVNEP